MGLVITNLYFYMQVKYPKNKIKKRKSNLKTKVVG